jgi:hypothetical protein
VQDRWHAHRFGVFVIALPSPLLEAVAELRAELDPVSAGVAAPHLTVTQPLAEAPNDIARADLGAALAESAPFDVAVAPCSFRCEALELWAPGDNGRFAVVDVVPFIGG